MNVTEMLVDQLESVRRITLETFSDLAPRERLHQAAPGVNHPLWLLGHIATSEDHLVLDFCAGRPLLPKNYGPLFGIGSKPLGDASAYPAAEEVLTELSRVHKSALAYVRGASAAELDLPPVPFERMEGRARELFRTRGRCIWFHGHHEAMHAGQMGYIRRLLGKPYRI